MKTSPSKPRSQRVSLSGHELGLILGALAETLEEKRTPYTRVDLARLVRLHRRLELLNHGAEHDYALRNGAVVAARDPSQVISSASAVAPGWSQLAASHG